MFRSLVLWLPIPCLEDVVVLATNGMTIGGGSTPSLLADEADVMEALRTGTISRVLGSWNSSSSSLLLEEDDEEEEEEELVATRATGVIGLTTTGVSLSLLELELELV